MEYPLTKPEIRDITARRNIAPQEDINKLSTLIRERFPIVLQDTIWEVIKQLKQGLTRQHQIITSEYLPF
jgi:hypothetical protein